MTMRNRRLIELSIPLDAISKQSAREKSIRHGHISTLHIWWARRPLAACRAAVFAALVDAPDDPAERERLEELITTMVDWDQVKDGNSAAIEEARRIIHEQWGNETPRVLDMFAGGGAIPLEALRLGCEAHALELNPVAYLILLCTLVYPQKYGQPVKRKVRHGAMEIEEDVNPLAQDVRRWGEWVLDQARKEIGQYYEDPDGNTVVAYLWARTARCPNPACGAEMPLVRQWWLAKSTSNKVALRPVVDREKKEISLEVLQSEEIDFDPSKGTMRRGSVTCLFCGQTADAKYLRGEGKAGRLSRMPLAVVLTGERSGKTYRPANETDRRTHAAADAGLERLVAEAGEGLSPVPDEPIPAERRRGNSGFRVLLYGMSRWGDLFSARQALSLATFSAKVRMAYSRMLAQDYEAGYAQAVATYLAVAMDRMVNQNSTQCVWVVNGEKIAGSFGRQALPMVWDHAEANPVGNSSWSYDSHVEWVCKVIEHATQATDSTAFVRQGTATRLPHPDDHFDAVITDPPYYDAVAYSDLSDFFYVWLKRTVGALYPQSFRTPLTPKSAEIIQEPNRHGGGQGAREFYETQMTKAFREAARVLRPEGVFCVVFAHKSTAAWETLIDSLLRARLVITASWPLHTERPGRLLAIGTASLASSIFMVCRKRTEEREGYLDDVRQELRERVEERLDFFWEKGIRGADFFISAIGPAVEVFGRYTAVRRLSGEEVTVGELLDLVQEIVTNYALRRILHDGRVGHVDPATRFYVLWRWAYGSGKVRFDDARKLAQAQGAEIDDLMSSRGVLRKRGKNVTIQGARQRAKDEHLGEIGAGGRPAALIDVLHRASLLWNQGDRPGLAEFLTRSGYARDESLWTVAQALSEILPEGDKEKQMLQGLLGSKERVATEMRQGRLFE